MPWRPGSVRRRLLFALVMAGVPVMALAGFGSHASWQASMERALREVELERDHAIAVHRALMEATGQLAPRVERSAAAHLLFGMAGAPRPIGELRVPPFATPPLREAAFETRAADGTRLLVATGILAPEIGIAVAVPAEPARAAALRLALLHLTEIVALLALGIATVLLVTARTVARPLRALRDAVRSWREGGALAMPDTTRMPRELADLAAAIRAGAEALERREAELRAATEHAELLAAEVHHRVKNNLQTVSSLLSLQAQRVADPGARAEFEAARDRIAALATLHRHLYAQHDPEAIDLAAFIGELGAQLFAAVGERPGRRLALDVQAPHLRIGTDQAVPLALIITEAVADALRQGFATAQRGRIAILLAVEGDAARLAIEDDGTLPREEDRLRAMLMRGLARQLGGEIRQEGGRVTLDFRLRPASARQPASLRPPTPPKTSPPAPSAPA